jgi:hypothetical protein
MKLVALLVIFLSAQLECQALLMYSVWGEVLKSGFHCGPIPFSKAIDKLVSDISRDRLVATNLTSRCVSIPKDLENRTRGIPLEIGDRVFGVALTKLCDAYGLAFREWRGTIIVFDPVTDRTGPVYDGYLSLPDSLDDLIDNDGTNNNLLDWVAKRGVDLGDGDGFEKFKNYKVVKFSGSRESRMKIAYLFRLVELGVMDLE